MHATCMHARQIRKLPRSAEILLHNELICLDVPKVENHSSRTALCPPQNSSNGMGGGVTFSYVNMTTKQAYFFIFACMYSPWHCIALTQCPNMPKRNVARRKREKLLHHIERSNVDVRIKNIFESTIKTDRQRQT